MTSVEEVYAGMRSDFSARAGVELGDHCDLAVRMYALAAQIYALRAECDWVRRQCFPQTAVGEYLDKHAQMRSLERKPAARAEGALRFYAREASDLNRSIPLGTVCMTGDLTRFETVEEGTILAGEMWADVPARAVETGLRGNAAAGTITQMAVAPVGVLNCDNPQPFTGGGDREGDESLRERVMDTFRTLSNGANAAFYRQLALSDPEVAAVEVIPRPRGVGSVDVVVASHSGMPTSAMARRLQRAMDEKREIAVDLQVVAPQRKTVDLAVQVAPKAGYDSEGVVEGVKTALKGHFTGKLLGQEVLLVQLGSIIYGCEGVENYRITAPAEDVAGASKQLPVLGTLTVEVMG